MQLAWLLIVVHCCVASLPQLPADGLQAFWNFQEPAGEPRRATSGHPYLLRELNGTVARGDGGVFGLPYSALFVPQGKGHGRLTALREEAPGLNIRGPNSAVTLLAWVRPLQPTNLTDTGMQTIAGIWSEDLGTRQYVLFVGGPHKNGVLWPKPEGAPKNVDISRRANAQVSDVGGPTPGEPYCFTRAWGASVLHEEQWHCLGMVYDKQFITAYVNGTVDRWELSGATWNYSANPYPFKSDGIFDCESSSRADACQPFTVGGNHADAPKDHNFHGMVGGLAVWNRALDAEEIAAVCSPDEWVASGNSISV